MGIRCVGLQGLDDGFRGHGRGCALAGPDLYDVPRNRGAQVKGDTWRAKRARTEGAGPLGEVRGEGSSHTRKRKTAR